VYTLAGHELVGGGVQASEQTAGGRYEGIPHGARGRWSEADGGFQGRTANRDRKSLQGQHTHQYVQHANTGVVETSTSMSN
jgi:hypothetical protein